MKALILSMAVVGSLLAGCAVPRLDGGAASDTDQNVLTGGPIRGTAIKDLPQVVRDRLRERVARAEIADIDRITREGRVLYRIMFTEPNKYPRIEIAEDGQIQTELANNSSQN